jgi:hypothetical protein
MIDPCQLSPLICQNNSECAFNISSNTTYCRCDQCHYGVLCENNVWREGQFDTVFPDFIATIIETCFSILNNGLVFELLICCRRIRSTNCGIYLFLYSILSLLAYIFFLIAVALQYYPNQFTDNASQYEGLVCLITGLDSSAFFYLCIWFSSFTALERGLIIYSGSETNASRWRPFVAMIIILAIAGSFITPMIVYKCDWDNVPGLQTLRSFCQGFFIVTGIVIYVVATVFVLISFVHRIRQYGMENGCWIKTFLKLLYKHLFVFIPPLTYGICQIPFTIATSTKNQEDSYYQCGISLGEFIIKVLMGQLTNIPYGLTWLLFVYSSRVYMNEFYLSTWSGQCLAKIIMFFRSCNDRRKNVALPYTNPTNNEYNNPVFCYES